MPAASESEAFLRAFHTANPGATSRALSRTGIYDQFAARVPRGRVLDLACGDGPLLRRLGPGAIGVDISAEPGPTLRARAQELPFVADCFDAVACQLAFMLFDDIEHVVGELARVLRPGGRFCALLGGGPTAEGTDDTDAFHAFARMIPKGRAFGDPRAKSEAGWRELFAAPTWSEPTFERWPVDLAGTFDEVWAFLGASYQLAESDRVRAALRERFPGGRVPCTISTYYASVIHHGSG